MSVERPITHDDPDVSVVVPTIPENSHEEVVEALREQTYDAFEVVVVNDATLDICEARNAGIEAANADIVALTDDDCRPPKDWVSHIVRTFDQHPDLVCLEGAVRGGREYDGSGKYVGCNLSFDRDSALSIDGFDSTFAGWRDDTEFGWRMEQNADGVCEYKHDVVMLHPGAPRANIDDELEKKLRERYPDRYDEILIPDSFFGKVNDWLWRNGFWDTVDKVRL